ncbi:hypothetical protein B0H19DRAFT_201555 [Mycena capillaripes]|nr:hypothetical protein B0H19DRAFT_201555 [Mycena capillaripes]
MAEIPVVSVIGIVFTSLLFETPLALLDLSTSHRGTSNIYCGTSPSHLQSPSALHGVPASPLLADSKRPRVAPSCSLRMTPRRDTSFRLKYFLCPRSIPLYQMRYLV